MQINGYVQLLAGEVSLEVPILNASVTERFLVLFSLTKM